MRAKEATLLSSKLKQVRKLVSAITPEPENASSMGLQNNSIVMLNGLIKDVQIIFENDKRYASSKKKNTGVYKTGYPCKAIKPRKRGSNANNTSVRTGNTY